jgi:hypothetical protein
MLTQMFPRDDDDSDEGKAHQSKRFTRHNHVLFVLNLVYGSGNDLEDADPKPDEISEVKSI